MIEYVDRCLKHWAQEMSVQQRGVHLGYRRGWGGTFTECVQGTRKRLTARGKASRSGPVKTDLGPVAERVNQAVERLPEELQTLVNVAYLEFPSATAEQKALILNCSKRTFYENMHRAHQKLSDDLPDTYVDFTVRYPQCG